MLLQVYCEPVMSGSGVVVEVEVQFLDSGYVKHIGIKLM